MLPPDQPIAVGQSASDAHRREKVIDLLQQIPNVMEMVRKLPHGDTFRVVMSSQNASLFHAGPNGIWAPVLRDAHGVIRGHVGLIQAGPHIVSSAGNIIMAVAMAAVARKLAIIDAKVDRIAAIIIDQQRGRLQGALTALSAARQISVPADRRAATLNACSTLVIELTTTAGQLKALVDAMPEERTGLFQGFFSSGFHAAQQAYDHVQTEVEALVHGTAELLDGYAELDESGAAKATLMGLIAAVNNAALDQAVRKARLLPAKPGQAPPEAVLQRLQGGVQAIGSVFMPRPDAPPLAISLELKPQELCLV